MDVIIPSTPSREPSRQPTYTKFLTDPDELSAGEVLMGADGRSVEVTAPFAYTGVARAFNLGVASVHTYHVGQYAVVVHNDCGPLLTRRVDELGKRIVNPPAAPRYQTDALASHLGYRPTGAVDSRGQMIYKRGRNFIVQDVDSHNGGFWKMARSTSDLQRRSTRSGTYDFLLERIGE